MGFTYLLINIAALSIPLAFSFHPKIQFYKKRKAALIAIAGVAIPFIIWDALYVDLGVWWFATEHTSGISFFGLPLSEMLFFVCIPYACIFTYFCLRKFYPIRWSPRLTECTTLAFVFLLLFLSLFTYPKLYTSVVSLLAALILVFIWRTNMLWLPQFYFSFAVILIPFFIVNGLLTRIPVVLYDDAENLGIRLISIPVEDTIYALAMLLLNIGLFEYFEKRMYGKEDTSASI